MYVNMRAIIYRYSSYYYTLSEKSKKSQDILTRTLKVQSPFICFQNQYYCLFQDIFQNLKKDIDTNTSICLSTNQLRTLIETNQREASESMIANHNSEETQETSAKQDGGTCDVVLFTCGHHFTRETFLQSIVPSFEVNLSQSPNNLPQTASLLSTYYRRKGEQPTACPRCVLSTIQSTCS